MNGRRAGGFAVFFILLGLGALALGGAYYRISVRDAAGSIPEKTVDDYLRDGEKYLSRGAYREAIISYEQAASADAENAGAFLGLGEAYTGIEDYAKAEEAWQEVLRQGNNASACLSLARLLILQGRRAEARELVLREAEEDADERLQSFLAQTEVSAPEFSLPSGSYDSYQLLTASSQTDGAVVYFTLDGSAPDEYSMVLSDGIVLSDPEVTVTAVAINGLGFQSDPVTQQFQITVPPEEYIPRSTEEESVLLQALFQGQRRPIYNYDLARLRTLSVAGNLYRRKQDTLANASFSKNRVYYSTSGSSTARGALSSPDFLTWCPFLKTLNIAYQESFSPESLSSLSQLEELSLLNDGITDISALSSLTGLRRLALGWNEISDISAISGMTDLQSLGLWNNQISDLTAIAGLKKLEVLDVSGNLLEDASVCGGFSELRELWVKDNRIRDLSFTDRLEKLNTLFASGNPVENYGSLAARAYDLSAIDLTE